MNQPKSARWLPIAGLFLCSVFLSEGQVLVGPVVGGHINFLSFGDKDNLDIYKSTPYFGFHAGASISFRVNKNFFLQTSILYSQKGKKIEGKADEMLKNSATYQYIDVPILFTKEVKFKFGKDSYYKLHLGVGPLVSYWLGGKGNLTNSELNENGINPPEYAQDYQVTFVKEPESIPANQMNVSVPNRVQLGLNFSAGLLVEPDRFSRLMFTLQYSLGHSYLSLESDGQFGLPIFYKDELSTRFHTASLSVAYFIDLQTETRKKGKSTSKVKK